MKLRFKMKNIRIAFEELKQRADWQPPEEYNTAEKFICQIFRSIEERSITNSEIHLLVILRKILEGEQRMKPIKFKEQNVVIGKGQKQYSKPIKLMVDNPFTGKKK